MQNTKHSDLLIEATRIGDEILSHKIKEKNGLSWKTMREDDALNIVWDQSESIYSGVGGIALFLIELYKQTTQKKYLNAAIRSADWLIYKSERDSTSNYAFFTGRMGLTYVFVQIYHLTGKTKYVKQAIKIALKSTKLLDHPDKADDLINGTSGTLLGLLILHSETQDKQLLPIIEKFIAHLIGNFYHGDRGIFWDKSPRQINGLCGFSHGAAGVGYVFLMLGSYFENSAFYLFAEQAFAYENHHFDKNERNWPDFRLGIKENGRSLDDCKEAYLKQELDWFINSRKTTCWWCHGAPGIGLSRLLGWQLLKKEYCRRDLERALKYTRSYLYSPLSPFTYFTLCHGMGGNAMLYLDAYKYLGNKEAKKIATSVAFQAQEFKSKYGYYTSGYNTKNISEEDFSLFMGNAGIGYFYLMCEKPHEVPSILAPRVTGICKTDISPYNFLSIDKATVIKQLLQKGFPRTIHYLKDNLGEYIHIFEKKNKNSVDVKETFAQYINQASSKIENRKFKYLNDLYKLENSKLKLELKTNPIYQNTKLIICDERAKKLLKLPEKELIEQELVLDDDAVLYKSNWFWPLEKTFCLSKRMEKPKNSQSYLLIKYPLEVKEYDITQFSHRILKSFTEPCTITKSIEEVAHDIHINTKEEGKKVKNIILEQIKEFIRTSILVRKDGN